MKAYCLLLFLAGALRVQPALGRGRTVRGPFATHRIALPTPVPGFPTTAAIYPDAAALASASLYPAAAAERFQVKGLLYVYRSPVAVLIFTSLKKTNQGLSKESPCKIICSSLIFIGRCRLSSNRYSIFIECHSVVKCRMRQAV